MRPDCRSVHRRAAWQRPQRSGAAHAIAVAAVAVVMTAPSPSDPLAQTPTAPGPCTSDDPVVTIRGLGARQPFGTEKSFSLDWDTGAATTADQAGIVMRHRGSKRSFYESSIAEDDDLRFFVRIDLNDKPVEVVVTSTETSPDGRLCTRTVSQTVSGFRHFVLPGRCNRGWYRPRSIVVACGDGNLVLQRLVWRGWNRTVATGAGIAKANDCIPYCAVGHFRTYRARVRAYRIRRCEVDNNLRYTRLSITFVGGSPYPTSTERAPFSCLRPLR
jgi:hypothetical protein